MQKKLYAPKKEELLNAPRSVLYEIRMFQSSARKYVDLADSFNKDSALCNAVLEATLLHTRNLLDFFTGDPIYKDDIQAGHFVVEPSGDWWKSNKMGSLSSRRTDLNYSLSHLTYRRTNGKPSWDVKNMIIEVTLAFEEFLALLPESEQSRWVI